MGRSTVAESSPPSAPADPSRTTLRVRKLSSLTGVLPLGVFLVGHLWIHGHAIYGRESFNRAVSTALSIPMSGWLELLFIALPLAIHAICALVLVPRVSTDVVAQPAIGHWLSLLQRVTGVLTLGFIALHFWQYRAQALLGRLAWRDFYYQLTVDLNRPVLFALFVTGVTASVFHFSFGLWQAGGTWGITVSAKSQRRAAWLWGVAGVCVWLIGVNVLMHFALRCGGILPMPHAADVARACGR